MIKVFLFVAASAAVLAYPALAQPHSNVRNPQIGVDAAGDSLADEPKIFRDLSLANPATNYFHRAGATLEEHDEALRACASLAGVMDEPNTGGPPLNLAAVPGAYSVAGAGGVAVAGAIHGGIAEREAERREPIARIANIENCMVVSGWDVRGVSPDEDAWLRSLPLDQLRGELSARVGAVEPRGPLLRSFANEVAGADFTFGMAAGNDQSSLSVRLVEVPRDGGDGADQLRREARRVPERWARLMPRLGLVAVRLRGDARHAASGVHFVRLNQAGTRPATDGQPNSLSVYFRDLGEPVLDEVAYFEAPAGRWRLAGVFQGDALLSLCLGAPEFSLDVGQGVFAGSIDFTRSIFPQFGDDAVTENRGVAFTPAAYSQGGQVRCAGAYLYALLPPSEVEDQGSGPAR